VLQQVVAGAELQQVVAGAELQQVVPQLEAAGRKRATTLKRRLLQQVPQVLLQLLQAGAAQVVQGAGVAQHEVLQQRLRRKVRTRR